MSNPGRKPLPRPNVNDPGPVKILPRSIYTARVKQEEETNTRIIVKEW